MGNFHTRSYDHDQVAIPMVIEKFESYGFGCHIIGTELDKPETRRALSQQTDPTSMVLRYRPDRAFIKEQLMTVMAEIKSENRGYSNFSIEFDSFWSHRQLDCGNRHAMYAFVDLGKKEIRCCWVCDVPFPNKNNGVRVAVPKRFDFDKTWERLTAKHHDVEFYEARHNGGSGTPYFLIPKSAPYLVPIDDFIKTELLPSVQNHQGNYESQEKVFAERSSSFANN